jgi:hypothetical protein
MERKIQFAPNKKDGGSFNQLWPKERKIDEKNTIHDKRK